MFEENSVREITWLSWRNHFRGAPFSKMFSVRYDSGTPAFSNSSGLKRVFEKLCSRDGLVWTVGPTVEIKLRFQIPPAQCGRCLNVGTIMCNARAEPLWSLCYPQNFQFGKALFHSTQILEISERDGTNGSQNFLKKNLFRNAKFPKCEPFNSEFRHRCRIGWKGISWKKFSIKQLWQTTARILQVVIRKDRQRFVLSSISSLCGAFFPYLRFQVCLWLNTVKGQLATIKNA